MNRDYFKNTSLCVVGNINRDIKTAPLAPIESLFRDGETSVASVSETIGGGGANSACAAAYLGAKTAFAGKVGADALGDALERTLVKHSIAAHLTRGQPATGTSLALAFTNGQRHFLSCLANNESMRFDDLDLKALAGYRHLLRADIWFSEPMLFGGNEQLFQHAHRAGLEISMDLNWDPQWGRAEAGHIRDRKQAARSVLKWVKLAHGNVRELNEFTDAADLPASLRRLEEWGVKAVVVHLGTEGAGYYENGSLVVAPAAPAKTRVNTTGTGDVLSACMMLLSQRPEIPILERLQISNGIVSEFIEGQHSMIPAIV